MNTHEENLQRQIEEGKAPTGIDADAYRKVFSALGKEPEIQLSVNFAKNVVSKLATADKKKESKSDILYLVFGLILIGIALVVAMMMTSFRFEVGIFSFIAGYKGLLIFGAAFVVFLNWLDKRLISKQHSF